MKMTHMNPTHNLKKKVAMKSQRFLWYTKSETGAEFLR